MSRMQGRRILGERVAILGSISTRTSRAVSMSRRYSLMSTPQQSQCTELTKSEFQERSENGARSRSLLRTTDRCLGKSIVACITSTTIDDKGKHTRFYMSKSCEVGNSV